MEKENHIKGMFGSIYPKHYSRYPGVVQLVARLIWDQEDFSQVQVLSLGPIDSYVSYSTSFAQPAMCNAKASRKLVGRYAGVV